MNRWRRSLIRIAVQSSSTGLILVPLGVVFAAGGVIGGCLLYKRKHESEAGDRMKKLCAFLCLMCLTAALSVPASAAGPLEYSIDAPGDPDYGTHTRSRVSPRMEEPGRTRMSVKTPP